MIQNHILNILIVDDDPVYRNLLRSILKERFSATAVGSPSQAFKVLKQEVFDMIICDFKLPEMNGLKVLEKVKLDYPDIEVIMISSEGDMDTVIGALRNGAADYFKKPFTKSQIWVSIERTLKFSKLNTDIANYKKKNLLLKKEIKYVLGNAIIGNTAGITDIKRQMEMVADTPDTSVLIIGESGTGKELVARGIHEASKRKNEFFGAVNMSAIPESLFESEFFGHKKGSFTGAIADKAGWFEAANNGSLFFDEIGEMSADLQVKLLRVLEDRKYTQIGTQKERTFDIRIISATNKTTKDLSEGNKFRSDLFYRIGTFIINIPPLRERIEDIPELSKHFLSGVTEKLGKSIAVIHDDALKLLLEYNYPGNIRELKNIIERAAIVCQGDQLLPQHFYQLKPQESDNAIENDFELYDLNKLEKQTILKVLQDVDYNKAEAARILNIEWNALHRRIQKHNILFP